MVLKAKCSLEVLTEYLVTKYSLLYGIKRKAFFIVTKIYVYLILKNKIDKFACPSTDNDDVHNTSDNNLTTPVGSK